jgi:hypothetical protein
LDQQLQTVLTSVITEDTLNQEMVMAAQAHRARIHEITAIPLLQLDENMLQLQTRCATLEEQAEDLRGQLQAYHEQKAEEKIISLRKKVGELQKELAEQMDAVEAMTHETRRLSGDIEVLKFRATKVSSEFSKETELNAKVMRGLKARVDTAESELERVKRKRKDSISPDRVVTGILKRPGAFPPSAQKATMADAPPASAQPTPKKSRTRRNRWNEHDTELTQHSDHLNSADVPLTSFNQDGVKEKKEQTSLAKKRDPVLNNPPSSVRRKNDIINEIEESAKTHSLSGKDTSLVFHRSNVDDQVVVTKKALAYVESIITTTCVHLLKGRKFGAGILGYSPYC